MLLLLKPAGPAGDWQDKGRALRPQPRPASPRPEPSRACHLPLSFGGPGTQLSLPEHVPFTLPAFAQAPLLSASLLKFQCRSLSFLSLFPPVKWFGPSSSGWPLMSVSEA